MNAAWLLSEPKDKDLRFPGAEILSTRFWHMRVYPKTVVNFCLNSEGMKLLLVSLLLMAVAAQAQAQMKTIYDFQARTIDGEEFDFSVLKGKKIMIVNTASTCSLTPQYKRLQELYEEYGGDDFEIVAFPANDFFNREPGTNAEIKEFCTKKFGVTFRLMEKISVKGDSIHPVYQWLTSSKENGVIDAPVKWNFQKFLINPDGTIEDVVEPWTRPDVEKVVKWILSEN